MLRVEGTAGALRVGYQVAAELGAWTLELLPALPRAYRLSGRLRTVSDYWLAQRPLDIVLEVGSQRWCWPDIAPTVRDDGALTVTLLHAPRVLTTYSASKEASTSWVQSGR